MKLELEERTPAHHATPDPATSPLRVLFVIPGEPSGSSMIFARRQAESLREEGVEVHEFFLLSRTSPGKIWQERARFREAVARLRPDVIHAHFGTVTAIFAAIFAPHIPLVITYRGSDLNPAPGPVASRMRAAIGRVFSQFAALHASAIVCVSRRLRDRLWWKRASVRVLASGVDPHVFTPGPRKEARRTLGWGDDERVVLFNAGHDPRVKRLDLARETVDTAVRWIPRLRLEVLHGSTDPEWMPVYMNAADCLLLTSDSEGSPTVIQEALATNLPIVSVDVGDTSERLDGVGGTAIAPRDPEALAIALARILSERRRSDGRRKVDEFSLQRIAKELAAIYQYCARPKPAKR